MLTFARKVQGIVAGKTFETYRQDDLVRGATERYIEIIGEAASKVSDEFRNANPHIPWQKIVVTRHRFIHEYYGLDPVIVWRIATVHLEVLVPQLEALNIEPPPER